MDDGADLQERGVYMKQIIIPMFNVTLNINPIAFYIFGIPVYWYAILIVGSIVLALYRMKRRDGASKKVVPRWCSIFSCKPEEQGKCPTTGKIKRKYIRNSL